MKNDKPILINMPDHPDKSDKKRKVPGSDKDHSHDIQNRPESEMLQHDLKRQHGKTRKDLKK